MSTSRTEESSSISDVYNCGISSPGDNDVMLGRGAGPNNHIGNIRFRQLVASLEDRYKSARKNNKPIVAAEVVELWKRQDPPGRFLVKKQQSQQGENMWFVVDDAQARRKASQCFRDQASSSSQAKDKIRSSSTDGRPFAVESNIVNCTETSAIGHFLYEGYPKLNAEWSAASSGKAKQSKSGPKQNTEVPSREDSVYQSTTLTRNEENTNEKRTSLQETNLQHSLKTSGDIDQIFSVKTPTKDEDNSSLEDGH